MLGYGQESLDKRAYVLKKKKRHYFERKGQKKEKEDLSRDC